MTLVPIETRMRLPISPFTVIITWSRLAPFRRFRSFYVLLNHPYFTLILDVFPLHQIAYVGVSKRMGLKLLGREIIFEEFQPM